MTLVRSEMLVLPAFELLKRQPDPPHVAVTIAKVVIPNKHGVMITYTLRRGRSSRSRDYWIYASLGGLRMSNTLHTTSVSRAADWQRAIESSRISVAPII